MQNTAPLPDRKSHINFSAKYRILVWRSVFILSIAFYLGTESIWTDNWVGLLLRVVGVALAITAAMGRIWCGLYISGRKNSELVIDGPYGWCRHPLYFFNLIGFLGIAAFTESFVIVALTLAAFGLLYPKVIANEDQFLRKAFPTDFEVHQRHKPALIPSRLTHQPPPQWTVNVTAFYRNIRDSIWFPLFLIPIMTIDGLKGYGYLPSWYLIY